MPATITPQGLQAIQATIFYPELAYSRTTEFVHQLDQATGGAFDGEPNILSLPLGTPPEVPRVKLTGDSGRLSCSISLQRTDLIQQKPVGEVDTAAFLRLCGKLFGALVKTSGCRVSRVSLVSRFSFSASEGVPSLLVRTFFTKGVAALGAESPFAVNAHFMTREKVSGLEVNVWQRVESERSQRSDADETRLGLLLDVNTLAETAHDSNLDLAALIRFWKAAWKRCQKASTQLATVLSKKG